VIHVEHYVYVPAAGAHYQLKHSHSNHETYLQRAGIFNFCKTYIPGILKILVAFSGYFSVTVMRHSSCRESLALRSCFSWESTRIGKRPRKWANRIGDNFSVNLTKLSDKCHQSKNITIHRRRKYYILLVTNLTHSLRILKVAQNSNI